MYVLIFLIVFGAFITGTNSSKEVESNYEFLSWSKRDILILCSTLGIGIILEFIYKILPLRALVISLIAYTVVSISTVLFVNKNREKRIEEYKEQIRQVYLSLGHHILSKFDIDDIDYTNTPFKVEKEDEVINKITVDITDPSKFTENNCMSAVFSLNKYFPYCKWVYNTDFPNQVCTFYGERLPPDIALFPGTDLRRSSFIPLGLSGSGEVGWCLTSKDYGLSSFIYEDGQRAKTVKLPTAPQCLTFGSTGGGKAIYVDQVLF